MVAGENHTMCNIYPLIKNLNIATFGVFFNGHNCAKSLHIFQWNGYVRLVDRKYFLLIEHPCRFMLDFTRTCKIWPREKSITTRNFFKHAENKFRGEKTFTNLWKQMTIITYSTVFHSLSIRSMAFRFFNGLYT